MHVTDPVATAAIHLIDCFAKNGSELYDAMAL
jgi:hypothetical protein